MEVGGPVENRVKPQNLPSVVDTVSDGSDFYVISTVVAIPYRVTTFREQIEVLDFFDRITDFRTAYGFFLVEWLHLLPLSPLSALEQCILRRN